jgi:hypothetical protein
MKINEAGATRVEQLAARLAQQPAAVREQVEALLDEIENRAGTLTTADAAEDAMIERMRRLGQTGLLAWAEHHCARLNATAPAQARSGAKKNCAG